MLRQLGETNWADPPANASIATAVAGYSSSGRSVFAVSSSQSRMEKRLDALEAKLDEVRSEIRDLSAKLATLIERLPPTN